MDLRFMAIVMAIAIIMDILGRMARKRAGEQQLEQPPEEGWNVLQALADADELPDKLLRDALPPGGTQSETREEPDRKPVARIDAPDPAVSVPRFDPVSWPEPVEPEWTVPERSAPEPVAPEPARIVPAAVPAAVRSEPEPWEPPIRDRAARPVEVRSRAPRALDRESPIAGPATGTEGRRHPLADAATLSRRTRSSDVADGLGLSDARALRRIVVAREVLGPPLALRDDERDGGGHRS